MGGGAALRRMGLLVFLTSGRVPSISFIHSSFLFSALTRHSILIFDTFKQGSLAAQTEGTLMQKQTLRVLFPHIPPKQTAEEDIEHTKGGLDLLT